MDAAKGQLPTPQVQEINPEELSEICLKLVLEFPDYADGPDQFPEPA